MTETMTNKAVLTDYGTGPSTQQAHFESVQTANSCASVFTAKDRLLHRRSCDIRKDVTSLRETHTCLFTALT
jgi:hypothetical protein